MGDHRSVLTRTGVAVALALAAGGCGSGASTVTSSRAATAASGSVSALVREARPIGRGPAFHLPARGPVIGPCRRALGRRYGVHVELFAADRVALIAAGVGARAPLRRSGGQIVAARCFGALVTRDPTGVVLVRPGAHLTIADLFASWGQPLGARRLLSFHGTVTAYVGGRRWTATAPSRIPLDRHAEIVLEVGPHVPPHRAFDFPPGT